MKKTISIILLLSVVLLVISCHKEACELYETYTEDMLVGTTIDVSIRDNVDSFTYDGIMITYSSNLPNGVST